MTLAFIKFMLTPRRIILTLIALIAGVVMIRLGFWQIDRLHQRQASNDLIRAQINTAPLNLNSFSSEEQLQTMEYRTVLVSGTYDFKQQIFLTNQVWKDQMGVHLLTPLLITGKSKAVLVDRGWIPLQEASPEVASKYDEPGQVSIKGIIKNQQREPVFGISDPELSAGQTRLQTWIVVNLDRIEQQVDIPLLPVYIQIQPSADNTSLPYRYVSKPDLSNGSHVDFAFQWFSFATIVLVGYPFLSYTQFQKKIQPEITEKPF